MGRKAEAEDFETLLNKRDYAISTAGFRHARSNRKLFRTKGVLLCGS